MAIPIPFEPGTWVVLVLREPREQHWGRLLGLEPTGVVLRGLEIRPWEEIIRLVMAGEADQLSLGTRYFPLHRMESLYVDEASSGATSLVDEFQRRTGIHPEVIFGQQP